MGKASTKYLNSANISLKTLFLYLKRSLSSVSSAHPAFAKLESLYLALSQNFPIAETANFTSSSLPKLLAGTRYLAELIHFLEKGKIVEFSRETSQKLRFVRLHSHGTHHVQAIRLADFPAYKVTWLNQAHVIMELSVLFLPLLHLFSSSSYPFRLLTFAQV